jgi:hypothetical protein
MNRCALPSLLCAVLAVSFSCAPFDVKKPAGFAELRNDSVYYAISPEGILFRVHTVRNYPEKNLDFWSKAVKNHLVEEGYQFIKEEKFDAPKKPGVLFEWGAPYGRENYIYLTGIIVSGGRIAVAEAACEYSLYATNRDSLLGSIKSIVVN